MDKNDDEYSENELYDLFSIEYSDEILDIFYEVQDYCKNNGISIDYNYGKFFNLIYNNVDVKNSIEYLNIQNNEQDYSGTVPEDFELN